MATAAASDLGVGARLLRKEDARHLLGRGRFVADLGLPRASPATCILAGTFCDELIVSIRWSVVDVAIEQLVVRKHRQPRAPEQSLSTA